MAGVARQVGSTRGGGCSGLLALICYVAEQWVATVVFGALVLIFLGMLYYKNVSFVIAKRLLREPNVVMILVLVLCNWILILRDPQFNRSGFGTDLYC